MWELAEFKIGFDAKHLPCQKMSANEVYFLFVLIAQNLIRWAAVLEQPDKPHFSKKLRRKLIGELTMANIGVLLSNVWQIGVFKDF